MAVVLDNAAYHRARALRPANANATRPLLIHADLAQHPIDIARPLYAN